MPTPSAVARLVRPAPPPDAELLGRFCAARDEAAFAALVERHGPMVLGVCRRAVGNAADADDAFQATFLALARAAGRVRDRASVPAWLYGAAYRICAKLRRRRDRNRRPAPPPPPRPDDPLAAVSARELLAILDDELARLPDRYRLPLVLCAVRGLSQDDAAAELGWSPGSVKGRLERGRETLRARLAARGVTLSAVLLVAGAAVPPRLVAMTVAAVGGGASPAVVGLAAAAGGPGVRGAAAAVAVVLLAVAVADGPRPAASDPPPPAAPAAADALPAGAVLRLGASGFRVPNVRGVGFRADSSLVGLARGTLVAWPDPADPATRTTPVVAAADSWRQAVSADGRFVAARRGKAVGVWDVSGATPKLLTERPADDVYTMAFSPDGTWLAVNITPRTAANVTLCHVPTAAWRVLAEVNDGVECLAFSADGQRLAVTHSNRNSILVFDTAAGTEVLNVVVKGYRARSVALSPTGDVLAVMPTQFTGNAAESPRYLAVPSGEPAAGRTPPPPGRWVTFAPDGKTVLTGDRDSVTESDAVTGKPVRTYPGQSDEPVVWSADRRRVAGHTETTVTAWDAATGNPLRPDLMGVGHTEPMACVAASPDGRRIATVGGDHRLVIWDAATGRQVARVPSSWGNDRRAVFAPDGKSLFAVAGDGLSVAEYDPETGRERRRFVPSADRSKAERTGHLRLSPDGRTLYTEASALVVGKPGAAGRWDVATGREVGRVEKQDDPRNRLDLHFISPDGRWVVNGNQLIPTAGGPPIDLTPPGRAHIVATAISDDSRLVALSRREYRSGPRQEPTDDVIVAGIDNPSRRQELPTGPAVRLAFSPAGRLLAVVGRERVTLWELATGKVVRAFDANRSMMSRPLAMAFTPDGRRLVTGEDDCTAWVWDATATCRPAGPAPAASAAQLAAWWDALAGADAAAHRAGWELADRPAQAVPLVREKVPPAAAVDVSALVAKLDATAFADREAAEKALAALGDAAVGGLTAAVAGGKLSPEQRERVARLIASAPMTLPPGDGLRAVRAGAVLERAATPESRKLLAELAAGDPDARLTREAQRAIERTK